MKLNEDLGVAEASEQCFHLILSCYAHFLNYISLYLILLGIFCHEQTQTQNAVLCKILAKPQKQEKSLIIFCSPVF